MHVVESSPKIDEEPLERLAKKNQIYREKAVIVPVRRSYGEDLDGGVEEGKTIFSPIVCPAIVLEEPIAGLS
jgi:hypothetical protein